MAQPLPGHGGGAGTLEKLRDLLAAEPDLELAVLIGSRADGVVRPDSDWDFAIQWVRCPDLFALLGRTETLRRKLAALLGIDEDGIDLIDLPSARLAIREVVASQGVLLKGEGSLPWHHFLGRTWRELEEYQWEKLHAA